MLLYKMHTVLLVHCVVSGSLKATRMAHCENANRDCCDNDVRKL